MNQDKKLGLALGILLVGTVAALFFRNEQELSNEVPQLHGAQEVDEVIDEGFGPRPYPSEPLQGAEINGGPQVELSGDPDHDLDHLPISPGSSQLFPHSEAADSTRPRHDAFPLGPPDPVRITDVKPTNPTVPAPVPDQDPNAEWAPITPSSSQPQDSLGLEPETYRIQPGDTLTELARKFLGATHRFPEIYELNRDIMSSPDDLVVGKTIRIPRRQNTARTPNSSATTRGNLSHRKTQVHSVSDGSRSSNSATTNASQPESARTDGASPRKRFTRASRSPLRPGAHRTQTHKPQSSTERQTRSESTGQRSDIGRQPAARYYTVRRGDSLEKIAVEQYGSRTAARRIFEANQQILTSPNALPVGARIKLP